MQLFTEFNKLLQRSEPTIHVLRGAMLRLVKKAASRIVQPQFIKDAEFEQLDLSNDTMFKPNYSIFLGGVTKPTLTRLLNEGDITETLLRKFYAAAHSYFKSSLSYILKKFPLKDELIRNAVWIDVSQRIMVGWECVEYFYDRYSTMFEEVPVDILYEEFCDYQTLNDSEIGDEAWKAAKVLECIDSDGNEVFHYRADVLSMVVNWTNAAIGNFNEEILESIKDCRGSARCSTQQCRRGAAF